MTNMTKILSGGAIAAIAALAAATPASAQYYPYPSNPYGYGYANSYGSPYGYRYANQYQQRQQMAHMASQQCAAAVNARLAHRGRSGIGDVIRVLGGLPQAQARGQVVSITRVDPRRSTVRVRGLATSGRMAGYGPYGVGAYGSYGYAYQPDLKFKCDIDYRGRVRDIDIERR